MLLMTPIDNVWVVSLRGVGMGGSVALLSSSNSNMERFNTCTQMECYFGMQGAIRMES